MINAILAGMFIAIASYIYLQTQGIIGAFLFSSGLLIILNMKFKLFTGTVGYIKNKNDILNNLYIFIGNIIGTAISFIISSPEAIPLVMSKLALPFYLIFIKAIICGALIYIAVSCFKKSKDYMVPICVSTFILCGAEHCIADLCFMFMANIFSIYFFFIVTIGNVLGAILINRVENITK